MSENTEKINEVTCKNDIKISSRRLKNEQQQKILIARKFFPRAVTKLQKNGTQQ